MCALILYSDLDGFYASVECACNPAISDRPVAVCGDPEARHGIILAKNQLAKKCGVTTGETIMQARQKCRDIMFVKADYQKYLYFSHGVRQIYEEYTDQVMPRGLDEAALNVTGSLWAWGSGRAIAMDIQRKVLERYGVTCTVGIADNMAWAKLASDMQKPAGITEITRENYKERVWPLPAGDLLYVGPATRQRLSQYGIMTIGDMANATRPLLRSILGKNGDMLWKYANGLDTAETIDYDSMKSISHSTTTPRDLNDLNDIKICMITLAEAVAVRLRKNDVKCTSVSVGMRGNDLSWGEHQTTLKHPTQISDDIIAAAMRLVAQHHRWEQPLRGLALRCAGLVSTKENVQLSFLGNDREEEKKTRKEQAVDSIRRRYGWHAIQRAILQTDELIGGLNPIADNINSFGEAR